MLRRTTQFAVASALLAAAATFAPAAHADRVAFNVAIGGPGYAFSVGNAPYYRGYPPYHGGYRSYWRGAYVAPPVVYPGDGGGAGGLCHADWLRRAALV